MSINYDSFLDELADIQGMDEMEKEAFIQHLVGAGKALGAMGRTGSRMARTGWQAGQKAMQGGQGWGQALQSGWQAAGGKAGVGGQLGRAAQRGWKVGKGRMEQIGQHGATGTSGWFGQQKAMLGAMKPSGFNMGPTGAQTFRRQQQQVRRMQPRGFET